MADQQTPTAEEHQQAQQVAAAGAQAAATGGDAAQAMKDKRDQVNLKMSDEDIDRIAARLNELNIAELENRGAFEPPPERVQAPPADQAPPAPAGETGEAAQPADQTPPAPPQKRTAAHRFFGVS